MKTITMIFANFHWYSFENYSENGEGVWACDEDGTEYFIPLEDIEIIERDGKRTNSLVGVAEFG